ncbi:MAG: NAD(P)H-hydrate dehydratase [Pseudomonadota bacterium]|nr:NAD(P)H-hydrate dehydratase [Pseudomonadota bacterium]
MLAIVGTIPSEDFPIISGEITLDDEHIHIRDKRAAINRGTTALMAAAIKTSETLGQPSPFGYLAGDIGRGKGSQNLYKYLTGHLPQADFCTLTFHYLQPMLDWHEHLQQAIAEMSERTTLIADAGFMYAAKMSGKAASYDLFTPDIGELAFLADEKAPHPFYTRGFILHDENRVPDLISRAYNHNNAARFLLVKGEQDYLADRKGILATVDQPTEETLEAMGGTGDTLTGLVSALIDSGMAIKEAAVVAMKTNRLAGHYAKPTPATQVTEIIRQIPKALSEVLNKQQSQNPSN